MNTNRLSYLLTQYAQKTITPIELEELYASMGMVENHSYFIELIAYNLQQDTEEKMDTSLYSDLIHRIVMVDKVSLVSDVSEQVFFPASEERFSRRWGWAAASVLFLMGIGAYFWIDSKKDISSTVPNSDILPGRAGAYLTLADGSQVSLDSVRNATIALQGGVAAKVVNGTLTYEGKGDTVVYNAITTPKGRQFHVTLPDGTGVWLNAASSIRYPTVFAGKERTVAVTGEAYFEVAKNSKMPFRLQVANKVTVDVLGTHFNVTAYENDNSITTTLLEGSVKVSEGAGSEVLLPGQQAQVVVDQRTPIGINVISDVAIDKVMAWKNGLFNFEGADIKTVMCQISRWYDVEVMYEGVVPDFTFVGELKRNLNLEDLLDALKRTGINFKIEGKKIIVQP